MYIWLINHYAVPPKYYPLARQTQFAKHLMKLGHKVTIISASSVHNSSTNLINNNRLWKRESVDGIDHVYIKCIDYEGNGLRRVYNMLEFSIKLPIVHFILEKPDAIVSTSMPPVSCAKGLLLAKLYSCVGVAEIADLWPESIVAYGIASKKNPIVVGLRLLEKWIYKNADSVIFTMGGGYDYIVDQGWEKEIPREKVYFINNGVDLCEFDYNANNYAFDDKDLDDPNTFKVVYVGSFRKANEQIMKLIDAAGLMQDEKHKNIRFLLYGDGDLLNEINKRCKDNDYSNVLIKGRVQKHFIPYILSKCNVNILNLEDHEILRYGGSQNKLFDYLASGHPTITGETGKYSVIKNKKCGYAYSFSKPEDIVSIIDKCQNDDFSYDYIRSVAKEYDFSVLTRQLLDIIMKDLKDE